MLGQLSGEDKPHSSLDLARGHCGLLVVASQLSGLGGDLLKDVCDEGVQDGDGTTGNSSVRVHLQQMITILEYQEQAQKQDTNELSHTLMPEISHKLLTLSRRKESSIGHSSQLLFGALMLTGKEHESMNKGSGAYLLEDLVDVDLEGLNFALALLSLASSDLLGHLLGGLLLCLGCHGCRVRFVFTGSCACN